MANSEVGKVTIEVLPDVEKLKEVLSVMGELFSEISADIWAAYSRLDSI